MKDDKELNDNEKLDQENFLLKSKVIMKGGMFGDESNLPPEIENMFLKNVMAFEESEYKPICEILGIDIRDFPSVGLLSKEEIDDYLTDLTNVLEEHQIFLELKEGLPIDLVYKYLVEEYLLEESHVIPGFSMHIDGCDGDCPSCFQLNYCDSKDDIWPPKELAAEIKRRKKMG